MQAPSQGTSRTIHDPSSRPCAGTWLPRFPHAHSLPNIAPYCADRRVSGNHEKKSLGPGTRPGGRVSSWRSASKRLSGRKVVHPSTLSPYPPLPDPLHTAIVRCRIPGHRQGAHGGPSDVDHRRPPPSDPLLATTGPSRSARRSSGCGRRRTRARGSRAIRSRSARPATSSTGSRTRYGNWLARLRLSRAGQRVRDRGRSDRRDGGRSTRSTSSSSRTPRRCPFAYEDDTRRRPRRPIWIVDDDGPALRGLRASASPRRRRARSTSSSTSTRAIQRRSRLFVRMEAGRPDARRDARPRHRLLPRQRLAAGPGRCGRLGLAARFVSGYLIQLKPDIDPVEGPPGTRTDFSDLHAWAEVYLPGRGLDRARRDLGPALRRGSYPARRDAALPLGRADHAAGRACAEVDFEFEMTRHAADRAGRASPSRSRTNAGTR